MQTSIAYTTQDYTLTGKRQLILLRVYSHQY